jgi:hypothetical protein
MPNVITLNVIYVVKYFFNVILSVTALNAVMLTVVYAVISFMLG